jgi:hypothetical protein
MVAERRLPGIAVISACLLCYASRPGLTGACAAATPGEAKLRVTVHVRTPTLPRGANPVLEIELINPLEQRIFVRGFSPGNEILELAIPGRGFSRLPMGDHGDASDVRSTIIEPNQRMAFARFMMWSFEPDRWALPAGRYEIRVRPNAGISIRTEQGEPIDFKLVSSAAEFVYWQPDPEEEAANKQLRTAFLAINHTSTDRQEASPAGRAFDAYQSFLTVYPQGPLSDEVRYLGLAAAIDLLGRSETSGEDKVRALDSAAKWARRCIALGPPYTAQLLTWNLDRGGNPLLESAWMNDRLDLARDLVAALDEKYPDDAGGRAVRQVLLDTLVYSPEQARERAEALLPLVHDDQCRLRIEGTLANASRKNKAKSDN